MPALHIRIVLEARTKERRRKALGALTTKLGDAFGSTIERIKRQPEDSADQAMQVLLWVHLAERPLLVDELLHALATEIGHRDLHRDNFPGRGTFLDCCLGLVIIDDETSTVRLVHYSLQEYLKTQDQLFPRGHQCIAEICLTYLMFESATSELVSTTIESSSRLALFDYPSCEWGHHARKGYPLEEQAANLALNYCEGIR